MIPLQRAVAYDGFILRNAYVKEIGTLRTYAAAVIAAAIVHASQYNMRSITALLHDVFQ
jgi:hypothetical protein